MNQFIKLLLIASVTSLALVGCQRREQLDDALERLRNTPARAELNCSMDAMFEISNCGLRIRRGAFIKPPDIKVDIRTIQISLQAISANVTVANGQATLSLQSAGSDVGSAAFAYTKIGDDIVFDQPDQVNAWINSFNVDIDGFDLTLDNVAIVVPAETVSEITVRESVYGVGIGTHNFRVIRNGRGGINPMPE
jgi:hypothetical protein